MNAHQSLIAAALSGVILGASGCASTQKAADDPASPTATHESRPGERHACKGLNDCRNQGGCKTEAHACRGLNDCRAQGGCKG